MNKVITTEEIDLPTANEESDLSKPHLVEPNDAAKFLCFGSELSDEEWEEYSED